MLQQIKDEIINLLKISSLNEEEIKNSLEYGKIGDISSKVAFILSKEKKENPAKIASELVKKIPQSNFIKKIESSGPYINFYLSDEAYRLILSHILEKKDKFGSKEKTKEKVLMEYPSVNPNKPWHIGHLRNAILGESVARILEFDGQNVERIDYIDDLGLQVAQSLWGFLNFDSNPSGKFDTWLGHQYVGIAKKFEEDKEVVEGVRNIVKQIEEGDNEVAKAGRTLAEQCVMAQYQTAFDLGIYHDVLIFESDILRTIFEDGIELIKENNAVVLETEGKNSGCWVVKLSEDFEKEFGKMENPDKILIRSDGTAVYTGKDVIFHLWKFGKLKNFKYAPFMTQPNGKIAYKSTPNGKPMPFGMANSAINVIGVEQKYPQRVIVEVLRRLNFNQEAQNLHHLSYEHVGLPESKFSGRKGTWIGFTADELISEAKTKVLEKIKLDAPTEEKEKISKMVGVAAIKFSFLRTSSDKKITFKWEEALSMEGNSGPYVQYAYVRTQGIIDKTSEAPSLQSVPLNDSEKKLILSLCAISDISSRAARELAPHHIAQYLIEVASNFSTFYNASPVLSESDSKFRQNRLAITLATSIILKSGLWLLGIECPKRM